MFLLRQKGADFTKILSDFVSGKINTKCFYHLKFRAMLRQKRNLEKMKMFKIKEGSTILSVKLSLKVPRRKE